MKAFVNCIKDELRADRIIVGLTDKKNWRKAIYPAYKENRKDQRRPIILEELKQYLRDTYECWERPTLEADDVLGILSTSRKIIPGIKIIVSIDKDFKTVPGRLYNPMRADEGVQEITEDQADYWHMMQTLTGDASDGYPGCPGVGPKKAATVLAQALLIDKPVLRYAECLWSVVVDTFIKRGLTKQGALVQAQVSRICRCTDYDFKNRKVIPWNPNQR